MHHISGMSFLAAVAFTQATFLSAACAVNGELVQRNQALVRHITDQQARLEDAVTGRLERILTAKLPTYLRKISGRPPARYAATRTFCTREEFDVLQTGLCVHSATHH